MIAVSILMVIWTCGLQIMQRRSAKNKIQSSDAVISEDVEKEMVRDSVKV